MDLEKVKREVDKYGRRAMAREIGMAYPTLSGKLNEYVGIKPVEIQAIQAVLRSEKETPEHIDHSEEGGHET